MKTPEEKAREIVNRCRINEWPDDTPMQEIAVNQLLYLIAQALKDVKSFPQVTSEEIRKAANQFRLDEKTKKLEDPEYQFGIGSSFERGAYWMQKKLKGE